MEYIMFLDREKDKVMEIKVSEFDAEEILQKNN